MGNGQAKRSKDSRPKNTCFNLKESKPIDCNARKAQALDFKHKGISAYISRQYSVAINHFKRSVEFDKTGEVLAYIALCYIHQNAYDIALIYAAEAIKRDANNDRYYRIKGCILMSLTKEQKDIRPAKQAIDDYITALSIKATEVNYCNYYNARKLVYLFKQREDIDRKQQLKKRLAKYGINANKFLRHNFYDTETRDIPDYYTCPITLDIIKEPVTAISGTSYEKHALLEYFKHNNYKDPINPVKYTQGWAWVPNEALQKSINLFYKKEPWAFDYDGGQNPDYFEINFHIEE